MVEIDGDGTSTILLGDDFMEASARVSPDGEWVTFHSDRSGGFEVYVARFPDMTERQAISTQGGYYPLWSPSGDAIYFRGLDGREVWSVPVTTTPTLRGGAPVVLFEGDYFMNVAGAYSLEANGERFLMMKLESSTGSASLSTIVLVRNWFEELKRLVPID